MPNLTELFCLVDDFCKVFEQQQEAKLIATGENLAQAKALNKSLANETA
jgi:hypothetical protein